MVWEGWYREVSPYPDQCSLAVVLGGPGGDGDGEEVMLVVDAGSQAVIRARLADDPWADDMLTIESVKPWSVWLRAADG